MAKKLNARQKREQQQQKMHEKRSVKLENARSNRIKADAGNHVPENGSGMNQSDSAWVPVEKTFRQWPVETNEANITDDGFVLMVENLSPLHLGSGQADVNIDADVVHDDCGLPYFPSKRLKGLIYESGLEVLEMLEACGAKVYTRENWDELFCHGVEAECRLIMPNLYLEDYENMRREWHELMTCFPDMFQPIDVLEAYTSIRYQTKIDEATGVAADTSLRNMRVVEANQLFCGSVRLRAGGREHMEMLALALQNLQRAGGKRNRGFGELKCTMLQNGRNIQQVLIKNAWKRGSLA